MLFIVNALKLPKEIIKNTRQVKERPQGKFCLPQRSINIITCKYTIKNLIYAGVTSRSTPSIQSDTGCEVTCVFYGTHIVCQQFIIIFQDDCDSLCYGPSVDMEKGEL